MRRSGRIVVSALGALVVVSSAGCGSSTGHPRVGLTMAQVFASTMAADSADVTYAVSLRNGVGTADGTGVTYATSGAFSWATDQGALTYTYSDRALSLSESAIVDGTTTYSKHVPVPGAATGWMEAVWSGKPSAGTSILDLISGSFDEGGPESDPDPSVILSLLQAEATSVENLGGDQLGGTHTAHYRAIIPFAQFIPEAVFPVSQFQRVFGSVTLPVDYWVNQAGLLAQLQFVIHVLHMPELPKFGPFSMAYSVDLSNYGVPVSVSPPPSDLVTSHESCTSTQDSGFPFQNCETTP